MTTNPTKAATDINAQHYENLNGAIECVRHIGCSAQGVIATNPKVRVFNTDLTRWERLSARDKFNFAKFIGSSVICESCRGGY